MGCPTGSRVAVPFTLLRFLVPCSSFALAPGRCPLPRAPFPLHSLDPHAKITPDPSEEDAMESIRGKIVVDRSSEDRGAK